MQNPISRPHCLSFLLSSLCPCIIFKHDTFFRPFPYISVLGSKDLEEPPPLLSLLRFCFCFILTGVSENKVNTREISLSRFLNKRRRAIRWPWQVLVYILRSKRFKLKRLQNVSLAPGLEALLP